MEDRDYVIAREVRAEAKAKFEAYHAALAANDDISEQIERENKRLEYHQNNLENLKKAKEFREDAVEELRFQWLEHNSLKVDPSDRSWAIQVERTRPYVTVMRAYRAGGISKAQRRACEGCDKLETCAKVKEWSLRYTAMI